MSMVLSKAYALSLTEDDLEIILLALFQLSTIPAVDGETVKRAKEMALEIQAETRS